MEAGKRILRMAAWMAVAAVPLVSLAAFSGALPPGDLADTPKVGIDETLGREMLVLDRPAREATANGAVQQSIVDGQPVEELLGKWQYTSRKPSRFH